MIVDTDLYCNCTGIFGFTVITILLVPFYWIPGGIFSSNPRGVLEDIPDAFTQIGNNPMLLLPILGQFKMCLNNFKHSFLMRLTCHMHLIPYYPRSAWLHNEQVYWCLHSWYDMNSNSLLHNMVNKISWFLIFAAILQVIFWVSPSLTLLEWVWLRNCLPLHVWLMIPSVHLSSGSYHS